MTTKEMIEVMQAYEDGKEIEIKEKDRTGANWHSCVPIWNWVSFDYRVKPESKYVPYDNVSEVEKDKWIKHKGTGVLSRITGLDARDGYVSHYSGWCSLEKLFENFTYEDGMPCGKVAEA